jgi:hypothetical protein
VSVCDDCVGVLTTKLCWYVDDCVGMLMAVDVGVLMSM